MTLTNGTRLGSDEILAPLGMGQVYRASDTKLRREVAIQVLHKEFGREPRAVAHTICRYAVAGYGKRFPDHFAGRGGRVAADHGGLELEVVPPVAQHPSGR